MKLKSKLGTLSGHTGRTVLLVVIGAVVGAGATAIAAVPGSDGVINACYEVQQNGTTPLAGAPNLRIIDPSAGQTCNAPGGPGPTEHSLSWNESGPPGPEGATGAQGAPGTQGAAGPAGTSVSIAGQTFTLSDGKTLSPPANPIPPLHVTPGAPPVGAMTLGSSGGATATGILAWQLVGGSGGAAHAIQMVIPANKTATALLKACVTGKHIKSGTITARKNQADGGTQKIVLTDATVTSYSPYDDKGKSGAATPTEAVSLAYKKIKFTYDDDDESDIE